MKRVRLLSLFTAATAAAFGYACQVDNQGTDKPSCEKIISACHPLDTGSGTAHECHEAAEAESATEATCAAKASECLNACVTSSADAAVSPDASDAAVATQNVTIQFQAKVGSETFSCGKSFDNVGTPGVTVEPLTFAFYIHDVRVTTSEGKEVALDLVQDGKWQYQNAALLDFEDKSGTCANGTTDTNTVVRGTFASASPAFTALKFKVGLPASLNHGNVATAASPLNLSSMFWDWQSGYKFMRLDFRVKATADAGPSGAVLLHLGSTECSPADGGIPTCAKPNVPEIAFTTAFNAATNKVVLDYAKLVKASDFLNDKGGMPGCMAEATDPECAGIFSALGLDIATGNPGGTVQSAFTVE